MDLTEEQKVISKDLIANIKKKQIQKLTGSAGTGKSFLVTYLHGVLEHFAVCAYTGKAANVLRKRGIPASTIHSLIYKPVKIDGKVEFELKDKSELGIRGFIVDEASMVSNLIYQDLISFNLPVIFVGDNAQLEPIGQDVYIMKEYDYKLEQIHRNAGEIAYFANHIKDGGHPSVFKTEGKVELITPNEVTNKLLTSTDQIICAYNKFRVQMNEKVRSIKGYKDQLVLGERIICLRNNKKAGLFNGMQGVLTKVDSRKRFLNFESDDYQYFDIKYDGNQFGKEKNQFEFGQDSPNPFDYAYTVTCHKYQGSEAENIVVYEQHCDKWDHKRWAYTAASRAKEKLYWVTNAKKLFIPKWLE